MEERRRYIRWKVPAKIYERWDIPTKVNYRVEETKIRSEALCRDINTMGLRLSLNEELGKGTVLEMNIDIPGEKAPIFVSGEVAWQREVEEEGKRFFEVGLHFTTIKDSDKERIYTFVFEWGFDEVSSRWWQGFEGTSNTKSEEEGR